MDSYRTVRVRLVAQPRKRVTLRCIAGAGILLAGLATGMAAAPAADGAVLRVETAQRLEAAPACRVEDGSGQRVCVWDARHMGNGAGQSLVIRRGGTDAATITPVTHRRAHRLIAAWKAGVR